MQTKLQAAVGGDAMEQQADRVGAQAAASAPPFAAGAAAGRHEKADAGAAKIPATPVPETVHRALRTAGQPLDDRVRNTMELHVGADLRHVRVHADGEAAQSATALRAKAYTSGSDIVFASGEFAPQSADGRGLLAHELTHVVQQSAGMPMIQRKPGNDDDDGIDDETHDAEWVDGSPWEKEYENTSYGVVRKAMRAKGALPSATQEDRARYERFVKLGEVLSSANFSRKEIERHLEEQFSAKDIAILKHFGTGMFRLNDEDRGSDPYGEIDYDDWGSDDVMAGVRNYVQAWNEKHHRAGDEESNFRKAGELKQQREAWYAHQHEVGDAVSEDFGTSVGYGLGGEKYMGLGTAFGGLATGRAGVQEQQMHTESVGASLGTGAPEVVSVDSKSDDEMGANTPTAGAGPGAAMGPRPKPAAADPVQQAKTAGGPPPAAVPAANGKAAEAQQAKTAAKPAVRSATKPAQADDAQQAKTAAATAAKTAAKTKRASAAKTAEKTGATDEIEQAKIAGKPAAKKAAKATAKPAGKAADGDDPKSPAKTKQPAAIKKSAKTTTKAAVKTADVGDDELQAAPTSKAKTPKKAAKKAVKKASVNPPIDSPRQEAAKRRQQQNQADLHAGSQEAARAEHNAASAKKRIETVQKDPKPLPQTLRAEWGEIQAETSLDEKLDRLTTLRNSRNDWKADEKAWLDQKIELLDAQLDLEGGNVGQKKQQANVRDAQLRDPHLRRELARSAKSISDLIRSNGPNYRRISRTVKFDQVMKKPAWDAVVAARRSRGPGAPALNTDHIIPVRELRDRVVASRLIELHAKASPAVKEQIEAAIAGLGDEPDNLFRMEKVFNQNVKSDTPWSDISFQAAEKAGYTRADVLEMRQKEAELDQFYTGEIARLVAIFSQ